jgi:hypothetical protein
MLLVYTHKTSNRLKYILKLILTDLLGIEFNITNDKQSFLAYVGPKFSYSASALENELFFMSKSLLFEKNIHEQLPQVFDWNGFKVFFPTGKDSAFPFDIFAASFYLVSRYEEYLPYKKDEHERFEASESMAYKYGFLDKPIINYWSQLLAEKLKKNFPELNINQPKYNNLVTIDVDSAFAYKHKGFLRTVGGIAKSVTELNINELKHRLSVLAGNTKDPYDTFEYIKHTIERNNVNSIFFFLLADYGTNDKNVPFQNVTLQKTINSIADYSKVGIHPGYASNSSKEKLKTEHQRLEKILNRQITISRQHFLRLTLPETYRNLIELDVLDDYTMGYASYWGFRASIANSFLFYDLDAEIETKLRVHPFMIMEGTFKHYYNQSPQEFLNQAKLLINETKKVNGEFISLWHNDTLSNTGIWEGWRFAFEEMIKYAKA